MTLPFTLAPVKPGETTPVWDGDKFCVDNHTTRVLEYGSNNSGWTDELTAFHEDTAGDNHFIDNASRQYAMKQILDHAAADNPVILEIGCSSGFMLDYMRKGLPGALIMGADVVSEPLKQIAAKLPKIPLFRFDLLQCPLPDNSIDVVIMLNVLEHIEDDEQAIAQVRRILKPGGIVIIEVPAGPNLYDIYDKLLMHYRRYSLKQLTKIVTQQGFTILRKSHLGFFIYPGFWWVKRHNRRVLSEHDAVQKQQVESNINSTKKSLILKLIIHFELWLGKWLRYPIGIRCLLSIKKPVT